MLNSSRKMPRSQLRYPTLTLTLKLIFVLQTNFSVTRTNVFQTLGNVTVPEIVSMVQMRITPPVQITSARKTTSNATMEGLLSFALTIEKSILFQDFEHAGNIEPTSKCNNVLFGSLSWSVSLFC